MTARTSLERREGEGRREGIVEWNHRRIVRWWLWQGGTIAYPSVRALEWSVAAVVRETERTKEGTLGLVVVDR
jgi:hypothetical protein